MRVGLVTRVRGADNREVSWLSKIQGLICTCWVGLMDGRLGRFHKVRLLEIWGRGLKGGEETGKLAGY